MTIVLTGLAYVVEVLGLEGFNWRRPTRAILTLALAAALLSMLIITMQTSWLRDFFEFTEVTGAGWLVVLAAVAGALAGQFVFTRYWHELLDFAIANPRRAEIRADAAPRPRIRSRTTTDRAPNQLRRLLRGRQSAMHEQTHSTREQRRAGSRAQ